MTNTKSFMNTSIRFIVGVALMALAGAFLVIAPSAHAASYAYVDTVGDVRSITADDWMTAIRIAPGIHLHSGVLLLKSAGDFTIVGDNVSAF